MAGEEDTEVAGEAKDGRQAVDFARRAFPNVVLMDIRMPVLDGLEATRLICADPTLAKTHVARILAKLDCHDRAQLITIAYETRFVTPGSRDESAASDAA